jgi:hypothetical protein
MRGDPSRFCADRIPAADWNHLPSLPGSASIDAGRTQNFQGIWTHDGEAGKGIL